MVYKMQKAKSSLTFLHIFILNSRDYLIIKNYIIVNSFFETFIQINIKVTTIIFFANWVFSTFCKLYAFFTWYEHIPWTCCNINGFHGCLQSRLPLRLQDIFCRFLEGKATRRILFHRNKNKRLRVWIGNSFCNPLYSLQCRYYAHF